MTTTPQRTCISCRRTAPQRDLVRLVASGGALTLATTGDGGRGSYVCPRVECLDEAVRRRAFARALRQAVTVDVDLRGRFLDACAAQKGVR